MINMYSYVPWPFNVLEVYGRIYYRRMFILLSKNRSYRVIKEERSNTVD